MMLYIAAHEYSRKVELDERRKEREFGKLEMEERRKDREIFNLSILKL